MVIAKAPKCTELVSWLDSKDLRVSDSSAVRALFLDLTVHILRTEQSALGVGHWATALG